MVWVALVKIVEIAIIANHGGLDVKSQKITSQKKYSKTRLTFGKQKWELLGSITPLLEAFGCQKFGCENNYSIVAL